MTTILLDLEDELTTLLGTDKGQIERAVREVIVLELYRRRELSSGKAAELLGMPLEEFMTYTSRLGIPFFDMSAEEWDEELRTLDALR